MTRSGQLVQCLQVEISQATFLCTVFIKQGMGSIQFQACLQQVLDDGTHFGGIIPQRADFVVSKV